MIVEIKMKEIREEKEISLRTIEYETGIERKLFV